MQGGSANAPTDDACLVEGEEGAKNLPPFSLSWASHLAIEGPQVPQCGKKKWFLIRIMFTTLERGEKVEETPPKGYDMIVPSFMQGLYTD